MATRLLGKGAQPIMAKPTLRDNREVIYLSPGRKIQWCSDKAREWLTFFFAQPKSSRNIPELIDQWIVLSRNAAANGVQSARPFYFSAKGKRLVIRFEQDDPRNALLLLSEQVVPETEQCLEIQEGSVGRLTAREREVLRWISDGKTNSEIAIILRLSTRTVDKHVQNIFRKLGVKSRVAAMLHSVQP